MVPGSSLGPPPRSWHPKGGFIEPLRCPLGSQSDPKSDRKPHKFLTFFDVFSSKFLTFSHSFFPHSGEPHVSISGVLPRREHAFLRFRSFQKVSFFPSFFEAKSRSQASKMLTFRLQNSFLSSCLQSCKHRFRLGMRDTLSRSAFRIFLDVLRGIPCLFKLRIFLLSRSLLLHFDPSRDPQKHPPTF